MKPVNHPSNTRTLSAPAGWDQSGLPVDALGVTDQLVEGVPCVWSFWEPQADWNDGRIAGLREASAIILKHEGETQTRERILNFISLIDAAPGAAIAARESQAVGS